MVTPEPFRGRVIFDKLPRIHITFGRRPRRKGEEPECEPVEPPRPKPLAGGAAAELDFDN
jgi:hypothetical protein